MTIELTLLSRVSYRGREITGPRQRGLLALLAGDLRTGCGTARLVDGLWPQARPENPTKALQVVVSRLRAQTGADIIARTATGYRLTVPEDRLDTSAVLLSAAASAQHARAGDHAAALAHAEAGLALWEAAEDGDPGLADPLSVLRAERASTWRALVGARALALSRLGRHAEAVGPLTDAVRDWPRDEEVLLELLRCEQATVGPAAALARYETYRRALREELGTDPGPALQAGYQQLLRGETPALRHGVAYEPNPLLGRDADLAAVAELLSTSRVTSIVGTGGLGKTRLAHTVSRQARQRVVHLVALAGATSDDDVVHEVASALGVGESLRAPVGIRATSTDAVARIVEALGPGPVLLVLDNCEHVVGGAAALVHALVSTTDEVRVLTTSRASLGLSSESVYPLPELSLSTTIELFHQRARAARPGVDLPADAVRELCSRLDGLPLAVELAAARVRVMSVAELARGLDDRFALLRGGARDTPERHQTLRAVIDWSWNLLEPAGQAAMRALSVFPGGFTADAARHQLGDDDIVKVLEQLADQSLLKATDTASGTRLRMLETVREFSVLRRAAAGETDEVIGRFLAWARDFGVAYHESIFGTDLLPAVRRIRAEQDNLVQALRYALDQRDDATAVATSAVLAGLWTVESNFTRMATLAGDTAWVLSHFHPEPPLVEATRTTAVLCAMNSFVMYGPRPTRSLVALRRLPPAPPSTLTRAIETVLRAVTDPSTGEAAAAGAGLPALDVLCDSDDPLVAGMANGVASYVWESGNDLDHALVAARRTLTAFENEGTPWIRAVARSRIGELCLQAERGEEARQHLTATLSVLDELGAWSGAARVRCAIVLADLQRGALDEAERGMAHAVQLGVTEAAGPPMLEVVLRAEIQLARGDIEAGLRLWRRAADWPGSLQGATAGGDLFDSSAWAGKLQANAVIAHAWHGRLDLVEEIAGQLPHTLARTITSASPGSAAAFADFPAYGALLLALATVDLDRGERTGDRRATRSGVRMIALAEAFGLPRLLQPTMSTARFRHLAEQADRPAYEDAASSYADLARDALRGAASTALRARTQFTGPDPA